MRIFLSTDYQYLDSRLMQIINLEFFNNHITEVITTTSKFDEVIKKICVAKGVEFKIFDMGYRGDSKAIEMLVKDVDKFIILSKLSNSFYLELFKVNESWLILDDGKKYPTKKVRAHLRENYKKRIQQGGNISRAFDEEVTNVIRKYEPSKFVIYRKEKTD